MNAASSSAASSNFGETVLSHRFAGPIRGLALAALLYAAQYSAQAVTIVDTGPGSSGGFSLATTQQIAGEFTVGSPTTITSIEGWMFRPSNATTGSLFLGIAADNSVSGEIPGTLLFSSSFSLPANAINNAGWYGSSSLGWLLPAGTYWVTFGSNSAGAPQGAMPWPAVSPLANYSSFTGGQWNDLIPGSGPFNAASFGVRIEGSIASGASVPDSVNTLALTALSLAVLLVLHAKTVPSSSS